MAKPYELRRKYDIPDDEMIQFTITYHQMFNTDLPVFSAFDPSLNEQFATDWQGSIEAAETAARDLEVQDELAMHTAKVQAKLEECRVHFSKIKYFVGQAFPGNKAMERVFCFNDYEKARKSETAMIPFLITVHKMAVKYSVELLAINCRQEDIDILETLADELREADKEQEVYKKNRIVITQDRIKALNAAWEYVQRVNKASKVLFAEDYAKLKQYYLPAEKAAEPVETGN